MRASGMLKLIREMGGAYRPILMGHFFKVIGKMIKLQEKVDIFMLMVMLLKLNGVRESIIKFLAIIGGTMEIRILVIGWKGGSMEKVKKHLQMDRNTMVISLMGKKNGMAKFQSSDGSTYEGQFVDNTI